MAKLAQIATARQGELKDGRLLGFVEHGDPAGAPVFLFHDFLGNRNLRHPDDSLLRRWGIRLIGVDRPGYGMSTRKAGRSIMDVVEDVMRLSIALEIDRFAVLGFSAGGPYALASAYRFPETVRRCAVVGCLPPLDDPRGFRALHPFFGRLLQLAQGRENFFRMLLQVFFQFDARRPPERFLRELYSVLPAVDRQALTNPELFNSRRDMWADIQTVGSDGLIDEALTLLGSWGYHLQAIRIPVDIWWGESDTFCAPLVGQRMATMIPKAELRLEPQAGHFIFYTHWQAILQALTAD